MNIQGLSIGDPSYKSKGYKIRKGISKGDEEYYILFKNAAYKVYYFNIFLNQDETEMFFG